MVCTMGTIERVGLAIGSSILGFAFIYVGALIVANWMSDHSSADSDWNSDGKTTLFELFEGIDIGKRELVIQNLNCVEYFAYKDGLPIKTLCNGKLMPRFISIPEIKTIEDR